jgi:hypothetical protein
MAKMIKKPIKKAQDGVEVDPGKRKNWKGEYSNTSEGERIDAVKTIKKKNGNVKTKRIGYSYGYTPGDSRIEKTVVNSKGDTISNRIKPISVKRASKALDRNLLNNKNGGSVKKKMKNGGSLTGLTASTKRVGPVNAKGAWTKVQEKTLKGAKAKAKLTPDKQLGATKIAKRGMSVKKK